MGKFLDGIKGLGKALAEGLEVAGKRIQEQEKERAELEAKLKPEVTLDAAALKELQKMSSFKLEQIFQGKRVHLADDPSVYRELRNFSSFQISAIFGNDEE